MADEGNSTGSNVVWAIAAVIIVAILAAVFMSSQSFFRGDKKINVDVSAPAAPASR